MLTEKPLINCDMQLLEPLFSLSKVGSTINRHRDKILGLAELPQPLQKAVFIEVPHCFSACSSHPLVYSAPLLLTTSVRGVNVTVPRVQNPSSQRERTTNPPLFAV